MTNTDSTTNTTYADLLQGVLTATTDSDIAKAHKAIKAWHIDHATNGCDCPSPSWHLIAEPKAYRKA
jgi:hypothetical protein